MKSDNPLPQRKVRVPIRVKLTLPYLLLTLIVAIAAAYVITQLVIDNIEERFNKQLFEAGKISSELIVTIESRLLETLRLIANVEGVANAVAAGDANKLKSLTLGIAANSQLEALELFDLQGYHVFSLRHLSGGNIEDYEYATGGQTDLTKLDLIQNVLAQKRDGKGDKFVELIRVGESSYLYISGPLYDNTGELAGVVVVGETLASIAENIRTNTFAQVTFYDMSGDVLSSTLPFPAKLTSDSVALTIAQKNDASKKRQLLDQRVFETSNLSFSEILGAFEVRGDTNLGVLGIALSRNILVQTSTTSRWQIFLLVFIVNFLILLIGINLANRITRPLIRLVHASAKVMQGELNIAVQPESNDEISLLTESFNSMVASLNKSQQELVKTYDDTLEGWAKALELRDKETKGHSERVTALTLRVAQAMGIRGEALVNIRRGALLHDIGKIGIPDAVLLKEGAPTEEERRIIDRHPQDAYELLRNIEYLQAALEVPYCHHEKWDGTGYPRGLKGEEIPLSARIFSVVDVWDALMSNRPYRKALERAQVVQYIRNESGKHFDPQVVRTFIELIEANGIAEENVEGK